MGKKEMYNCLFLSWTCLCFLPGYDSEECVTSVLAKRGSVDVPKGGTLSLSCVVQHCGDDGWTGGWGLSTEGQFLLFRLTPRHHLSKVTLTTNSTRLIMDILNVNQSDHGMYQCQITWVKGSTSVGHMTYVNITAAIPPTSVRKVYSRVAVYVSTCLVITLVLGLAYHIRSKVPSQPPPIPPPKPPPRSQSARKDKPPTPKPKPKIELVYAALSKDRLEQQNPNPQRKAAQLTVYSSPASPDSLFSVGWTMYGQSDFYIVETSTQLLPTGHTLVESTLSPRKYVEPTWNKRCIDICAQ